MRRKDTPGMPKKPIDKKSGDEDRIFRFSDRIVDGASFHSEGIVGPIGV